MNPHRLRSYIYLVIAAAIWGAAAPVIKFTLGGIEPLPFLAYRFSISAIISIVFFQVKGVKLPKPIKYLVPSAIYGLLAFTIGLGALFYGLEKSTVLDLTLISTIGPLIITACGALIFKDHITKREKVGVTIVFLGALINSILPLVNNGSGTRLTGNIFIFVFLFADTAAILLAKSLVKRNIPSLTLTNLGFIIGALTIIPFAFFVHGTGNVINTVLTLPIKYHVGVWYMALVSGSLAYFLRIAAQKSIEVSEATLFSYLQPIFAIPLAILWLGEQITRSFIVGAILIAFGITIAEYKKRRYQ